MPADAAEAIPPEEPLPGDDYLIAPLVVTRLCPKCSRPTPHRQRFDSSRGWVLIVCRRCGTERRATVIGARPWESARH